MLWCEKYRPEKFNDIVGNKLQIKKCKNWLQDFKKEKKKTKYGLLLSGPPGLGKTSLARILLKEGGYDIIEFNASDMRNAKSIKENLGNIMGKLSITNLMGGNKHIGIIMDEVDGIGSGERGGISELLSFINPGKKKKKKYINPIICTCNMEEEKKIQDLKKECEYVRFYYPKQNEIYMWISKILTTEKYKISDTEIFKLINFGQNDFRKIISILEIGYKNKEKDIDKIISIMEKKKIKNNLFDNVSKLLSSKIQASNIDNLVNHNLCLFIQTIHENLLRYLSNYKNNDYEKLENLESIYSLYSDNDIYDNKIYYEQIWELNDTKTYLSCYGTNLILSNMKKYSYNKTNELRVSKLLSKASLTYNNYKIKSNFLKKIKYFGNNIERFNFIFLVFIMQLIYGNNINEIIKNYNMVSDDFDKPLKYIKIFLNNINNESYFKEKIIKLDKKILLELYNNL